VSKLCFLSREVQSYRLISLRQLMEIFKADKIQKIVRSLLNQLSIGIDDTAPIPRGWRELVQQSLAELLPECEALGLPVSCVQIREATRLLELGPVRGEQGAMSRFGQQVATTIETELSLKLFFFIPPERARLYTEPEQFGPEVAVKFPNAIFDIEEAAKCLALGRWTASVFHQMRVIEMGLEAFAKAIGAPVGQGKNWQQMLNAITNEINVVESTKPTQDWKERVELYSSVAAHLRDIKNAWRNPSMHVRGTYDEERAQEIFNATHSFMRQLAREVLK